MTDALTGLLLVIFLALGSATPTPVRAPQGAQDVALNDGRVAPARAPVPPSVPATGSVGTALISGSATWYRAASPTTAAAGPALRVGAWRGSWVTVSANGRSVRVRLTDVCWCPGDRIVDLDRRAFAKLAPLSQGVVAVDVEFWAALPQTDVGP